MSESKIVVKPKQTKEKVSSIEQWSDAFMIFMSIYLIRYPDKSQELLKYMATIRDAAKKFTIFSWRMYDEQFRMRQAITISDWGKINPDLWLRLMSTQNSQLQTTTFQSGQSGTCRAFNKGLCTFIRCRYKHECDLCGSTMHGMVRCQSGKSSGMSSQTFPSRGFRPYRYGRFHRGFQGRGRGMQWANK